MWAVLRVRRYVTSQVTPIMPALSPRQSGEPDTRQMASELSLRQLCGLGHLTRLGNVSG